MPPPHRDLYIAVMDEAGEPINVGNPFPVTGVISAVSGTLQSATVVGHAYVSGSLLEIKRVYVNYTTAAATEIVAAVVSKKIRVVAWHFWSSLNTSLEWRSDTNVVIEPIDLPSRSMQGDTFTPGFWMETTAGEGLFFRQETGTAATIRGTLEYVEV